MAEVHKYEHMVELLSMWFSPVAELYQSKQIWLFRLYLAFDMTNSIIYVNNNRILCIRKHFRFLLLSDVRHLTLCLWHVSYAHTNTHETGCNLFVVGTIAHWIYWEQYWNREFDVVNTSTTYCIIRRRVDGSFECSVSITVRRINFVITTNTK